jgi:hypothetical protein
MGTFYHSIFRRSDSRAAREFARCRRKSATLRFAHASSQPSRLVDDQLAMRLLQVERGRLTVKRIRRPPECCRDRSSADREGGGARVLRRSRDVDHREPAGEDRVLPTARTLGSARLVSRVGDAQSAHAREVTRERGEFVLPTGGGGSARWPLALIARRSVDVVAADVVAADVVAADVVAADVVAADVVAADVVATGDVAAGGVAAGGVAAGGVAAR